MQWSEGLEFRGINKGDMGTRDAKLKEKRMKREKSVNQNDIESKFMKR